MRRSTPVERKIAGKRTARRSSSYGLKRSCAGLRSSKSKPSGGQTSPGVAMGGGKKVRIDATSDRVLAAYVRFARLLVEGPILAGDAC